MIAGIASVFARHFVEKAKLKAYAAVFYAAAGVVLLFAVAFALVGLRHWMAAEGVRYAELWIALGLLVFAALVAIVGLVIQRRRPKTDPLTDVALIAAPSALRLAARRVDLPVIMAGTVLVFGVVVGRRLTRKG